MIASNDNGNGDGIPPIKIAGSGAASSSRKRFYKDVTLSLLSGPQSGANRVFGVLLDGRPLRTPARSILELPNEELAKAVAAEWAAQAGTIDPRTMPLTRVVNSALDGVRGREREVAADIVKYAASDLLCYRADRPAGLVARQAELWDPVLEWAAAALPGRFAVVTGLVHVEQDLATRTRLAARLERLSALHLAALHVKTTLTGSALLAYASLEQHLSPERAWLCAHVDEDWQIAQWGEDAEATVRRQARWLDFEAAGRLLTLLARRHVGPAI